MEKNRLEEYEIFSRFYKFLKYMLDRIEKYPRESKFTIGDRIVNILLKIQEGIIEGIYTKNRYAILKEINMNLEKLRIYMRLSFEKKYISPNQYQYIFEEINEIGKMNGGWIKQCRE